MGPAAVVTSTQEVRIYLPFPHFHQDDAIHIRKVGRNAFQTSRGAIGCCRNIYTVQFNGDDRSMVQ